MNEMKSPAIGVALLHKKVLMTYSLLEILKNIILNVMKASVFLYFQCNMSCKNQALRPILEPLLQPCVDCFSASAWLAVAMATAAVGAFTT